MPFFLLINTIMATLDIQPSNNSFLSNNKYEFVIDRLPNFTFFVQTISLPSMALGSTLVPNPTVAIPIPGNQLTFGPLVLSFIVDEDLQGWYEIYNWMVQLGNPESFDKLGTLTKTSGQDNSVTSDATLLVKTNSNINNWKFTFKDIFPTDLAELAFSSIEGQDFQSSQVTFSYSHFEANRATNI